MHVDNSGFLEIPIEIDQRNSLLLSKITDEIKSIELELTDESMLNSDHLDHVLLFDDNIIISDGEKIFLFDMEGKFIRTIGSKGQGPGEYSSKINHITIDEKNKILIVQADIKIICYDLYGKYLKESKIIIKGLQNRIEDMCFINEELFVISQNIMIIPNSNDVYQINSVFYKFNKDLDVIDSCIIHNDYYEIYAGIYNPNPNYLFYRDTTVFLFYPEVASFIINQGIQTRTVKRVLHDTLYRYDNNQFIPELKLRFINNGIEVNANKNIQLIKIFHSIRYIFVEFTYALNDNISYYYCYDIKSRIGYKAIAGIIDQNKIIEEGANIRHFSNNTELFYFFQTNMTPNDLEEPNPTLYIGTLKK